MYGVFYRKCTKRNGVTIGYEGQLKMAGKAIKATFDARTPDENPLYANNGVAENDKSSGSGGTLDMTLDKMTLETAADLYGTTVKSVSVMVNGESVNGTEIEYKGSETSVPIGTAYLKLHQENGERIWELVFYREAAFQRPGDDAETMGESIEWQTPEISGTVEGMQGTGGKPWFRVSRWPSIEAAINYMISLFEATEEDYSEEFMDEVISSMTEEDEEDDET